MKTIAVLDRTGKEVQLNVDLDETHVNYVPRSKNTKTGNIPSQWIGATLAESESTCAMCPLMQDRTCYSQFGTPKMGLNGVTKAVKRGKDKSLSAALEARKASAHYIRMGSIGDPGSINAEVYKSHDAQARQAGLGVLSYTHQWYLPHAEFLKDLALASADTWQDVLDAKQAGWRVALHVDSDVQGTSLADKPQGTIDGVKYFLCPAQRQNGSQCNTCGLCDRQKKTSVDCIIFVEHGVAMNRSKRNA